MSASEKCSDEIMHGWLLRETMRLREVQRSILSLLSRQSAAFWKSSALPGQDGDAELAGLLGRAVVVIERIIADSEREAEKAPR